MKHFFVLFCFILFLFSTIRKCVHQVVKMAIISCLQEQHRVIKRIIINFPHVHCEPSNRCSIQKLAAVRDASQVKWRRICYSQVLKCFFQTAEFSFEQSRNKPFAAMVLLIRAKNVIADGKRIARTHAAIQWQPIRVWMKNLAH